MLELVSGRYPANVVLGEQAHAGRLNAATGLRRQRAQDCTFEPGDGGELGFHVALIDDRLPPAEQQELPNRSKVISRLLPVPLERNTDAMV